MQNNEHPQTPATSILMNKAELKNLEKLIQTIPSEMLTMIKASAQKEGRSLDEEVTIRLLTTLINPSAFGFSALLDELMNKKFTEAQAKAEIEAREKGWMYVYQKEKLRLFVEFEDKLPKKFKESFDLENLKEEIAKVRAEIEAEKGNGQKGEGV